MANTVLSCKVKGAIASFKSADASPIDNLKAYFAPIQSGSGDPSPSNIRPIIGWTGLNIHHAGQNLINYNLLTTFDIGNDYGIRRGLIFTKPGTYYIKALKVWTSSAYLYARIKNSDGTYGNINYIVANTTVSNKTITIAEGQTLLVFNSVRTTEPSGTVESTIERFNGWGIVVSFEDLTEYVEPTGNMYSVDFANNIVYGGYVDLITGEVFAKWAGITTTWGQCTNAADMGSGITRKQIPMVNNLTTGSSNNICNVAPYEASENAKIHFYYSGSGSTNRNVRIFLPSETDDSTEITVITKIFEDLFITQLNTQDLKALRGQNYIWSDANGEIECTYEFVDYLNLRRMSLNEPHIKTASGSVAGFYTDLRSKFEQLKVAFEPIQIGSGDPSPSNIRPIVGCNEINTSCCGKNLFNYDENRVKVETLSSGLERAVYHTGIYGDGDTYFMCSSSRKDPNVSTSSNVNMGYCRNRIPTVTDYFITTAEERNNYIKLNAGDELIFAYTAGSASGLQMNLQKYNIQVEIGRTATSYEPYSGSTISVTFPVQGKNLCPPLIKGKGVYVNTGAEFSADNVAVSDYIPVNFAVNQNYYLSGLLYSYNCFVAAYNINKQYLGRCGGSQRSNLSITDSIFTVGTPQGTGDIAFLRVEQYNITNMEDIDDAKIQLEVGSTATTYEPYTNTIYGGSLDLTTGILSVEWKSITNKWSDFGNKTSLGNNTRATYNIAAYPSKTVGLASNAKCNVAPQNTGWNVDFVHFYTNEGSCVMILPNDTNDNTEIQVVYPLATPITYQLTPVQLKAFIGDNYIWADVNGTMTVKYWGH